MIQIRYIREAILFSLLPYWVYRRDHLSRFWPRGSIGRDHDCLALIQQSLLLVEEVHPLLCVLLEERFARNFPILPHFLFFVVMNYVDDGAELPVLNRLNSVVALRVVITFTYCPIFAVIYFEIRCLNRIIFAHLILPQPLRQLVRGSRNLSLILNADHWATAAYLLELLNDYLFVVLDGHDFRFQSEVHFLLFALIHILHDVVWLGLQILARVSLILLNFDVPTLIIIVLLAVLRRSNHLSRFDLFLIQLSSQAIYDHRALLHLKDARIQLFELRFRLRVWVFPGRRCRFRRPQHSRTVAFDAKRVVWMHASRFMYRFALNALLQFANLLLVSKRAGPVVAASRGELWALRSLSLVRCRNLDLATFNVHYMKH